MKIANSLMVPLSALALVACGGSGDPTSSSSSSSVNSSTSSSAMSSAGSVNRLILEESQAGVCSYSGVIDTKHSGYSGSGFVDGENASGTTMVWSINVPESNTYEIGFRFANGSTSARSAVLSSNGAMGSASQYQFNSTDTWTGWTIESQYIALNAGKNILTLTADTSGGLPNLDNIQFANGGISAAACENTQPSSQSSVSSSSSGQSSSVPPYNGSIRPAKLEGFGASTTGGQGGQVVYASTGTEINQAMCSRAAEDTPLIIMVSGTINHSNTAKISGNCDTLDDAIQFKSVSNISLIGVGESAIFDEIGIHLRNTSNIILQNLHIRNVKKSGSPTSNGGDAIGMESGVSRVWVDHNTLEASGGESDGYDSLLDMKAGVTNVTVSYNLYRDSSRAGLVGSSDSDNKNTDITFHHNWYKNIQQRTPLVRHGLVHSYNNYWSNESRNNMIHGINSRMGARVLIESNHFHNSNNPIIASDDSSEPGCWQTGENTFTPEIYFSRSVGNGALVLGDIVNGQILSTCSVSVPYQYSLDPSQNVADIVSANAGVGKIN